MLPREVRTGAELIEKAEKSALEGQLVRRQIGKSIEEALAVRLNGPVDRKYPRKTSRP